MNSIRLIKYSLVFVSRMFIIYTFLFSVFMVSTVKAGTPTFPYERLQSRKLIIGTTQSGATTDYKFSWQFPSNKVVGSVELEYCTDPYFLDPCNVPFGADMSTAILDSQSGVTGFSISQQTAGRILLTRTPAVAPNTPSQYVFKGVKNRSTNDTIYIRVWTYPTTDASGPQSHVATVLSSTANGVPINVIVPPILEFCVGITVPIVCRDGPSVGSQIDYGEFSSSETRYGTSQFSVATNSQTGYVVTANGNTMTSGTKIIDALSSNTGSISGTSQFGLNLRANSTPPTGADLDGPGVGIVEANYDNPNFFRFVDGEAVASAGTGTFHNRFTVTYIVNISPDQPPGIYNTTIAYIASAAF